MGASAWVNFTPYHPKPSVALRRLREQVFAAGQYRKPVTVQERLAELGPLPSSSELHRRTAEQLRQLPGAAESPEIQNLIAQSERLAEDAAKREPDTLRLMEALRTGTLDSLPEVQEWNALARQAFGSVPQCPPRQSRKQGSKASQIAMLLLQAGESGTHSILDITRVGKRPAHATAFPLRPEVLLSTFATTEPARAQVEATELAFAEELHWRAAYFAVYRDGLPEEWAFVGSSGD